MVQYEYANDIAGNPIPATLAPPSTTYYCVECNEEMYVANAGIKQHPHYRHKVETNHIHEGILHFNTKCLIFEYLNHFYANELPLYIVVRDCDGFSHAVDVLTAADDVCIEKSLSKEYRPDVSINGKVRFAFEIVDTHDMEPNAVKYVKQNHINLIKIRVSESVYRNIQDNFIHRSCMMFPSSVFGNVEIFLHNNAFQTPMFDVSNLPLFCGFGPQMVDVLSRGIECYRLERYELDVYMFTRKKRNEFDVMVCAAYNVLDMYDEDCDSFLSVCRCTEEAKVVDERLLFESTMGIVYDVLDSYMVDRDIFLLKCDLHERTVYNDKQRVIHEETECRRVMYSQLNVFRRDVMKTGIVTSGVERAFLDKYTGYKIYEHDLHLFALLCNVRGWKDDNMRYHWAETLDEHSSHPLLCGMNRHIVSDVTRNWNAPAFHIESPTVLWQ